VAQVADGSPAYEAGVRNGDVLVAWLTRFKHDQDPETDPAGTRLVITLKRGSETFKTTAILRNIVAPERAED
jgi:predicted metalloprotease with PDZ domain